jgi:AhpD family alkylhydroperoxidase
MRLNPYTFAAKGYSALKNLEEYASHNSIDKGLLELVKLRASQINGCTYCIGLHVKGGLAAGYSSEKLHLVTAWRLAEGFTERERAALAWSEAITLLTQGSVPDEVYAQAQAQFSESELVDLTYGIVTVNAWNRMQVAFRM